MNADARSLLDVRSSLKVKWYRSPIERETLRQIMQRSNLRGACQAVGHLGLWCLTGSATYYMFSQQLWVGFAIALSLHGTVGSFFKGLATHELGHGTVFRTPALNKLFLRIYSLLGWWNFHVYAMSHTYHHRYTLHPEGDREVILPKTPTLKALCLLQLFTVNICFATETVPMFQTIRRTVYNAMNRFDTEWHKALYQAHPEARAQAVRWARILLLFNALVIAGSFMAGMPILAVLISGHLFIGNWLRYFVGLPMHCGLRENVPDFRLCTRTITLNPIAEFLYWHMNWHAEHHMFAGVPCYKLAQLHNAIKDDMPAPRTLVGAWREMRQIWRRQQKEPGYQFDTPLPPTAGTHLPQDTPQKDDQSLESSIGDLAPSVLS